jgi:hypothetical protein
MANVPEVRGVWACLSSGSCAGFARLICALSPIGVLLVTVHGEEVTLHS